MEETNKAEFEIQVSIADATDEELDFTTRQLLSELRELNVESAELVKGESVTIGSITIGVLPVVLPSVLRLVQAWVTRTRMY
jgi:hypothetical protein